jgi:hypothetical protein
VQLSAGARLDEADAKERSDGRDGQLDDRRLHWRAIVGEREEWHAEIVDQVPDQRIAWRSLRSALNPGKKPESVGSGDDSLSGGR